MVSQVGSWPSAELGQAYPFYYSGPHAFTNGNRILERKRKKIRTRRITYHACPNVKPTQDGLPFLTLDTLTSHVGSIGSIKKIRVTFACLSTCACPGQMGKGADFPLIQTWGKKKHHISQPCPQAQCHVPLCCVRNVNLSSKILHVVILFFVLQQLYVSKYSYV